MPRASSLSCLGAGWSCVRAWSSFLPPTTRYQELEVYTAARLVTYYLNKRGGGAR
jgi:hypothetical protein